MQAVKSAITGFSLVHAGIRLPGLDLLSRSTTPKCMR